MQSEPQTVGERAAVRAVAQPVVQRAAADGGGGGAADDDAQAQDPPEVLVDCESLQQRDRRQRDGNRVEA
eukprot:2349323-Prymnesium_polylepis.1